MYVSKFCLVSKINILGFGFIATCNFIVSETDLMVFYIVHYFIHDIVEDSPRYEHTILLNIFLQCRRW